MADPATRTVALPAVVDLDSLDGVRDRLLEAMETGPVRVTGAAVERISTNALFMLLSAAQTAREGRLSFVVGEASMPMVAAMDRLGLTQYFAGLAKG